MDQSPKLDKEQRQVLYKEILRIRTIEEELASYYREQEMRCPVHFSIGQEAIAVGVCQALRPGDPVMSGHRSHAHYLAKGGDLKTMVAELYGKANGCASGNGGSMHLIDLKVNFIGATSIVAGTIPVVVGIGFANKLKDKDSISVSFFGDAATEEGLFYESLNFASLHKLPVLFVCENNLYSVFSPLSVRQPSSRKIYKIAKAMGINSVRIDGNDVEGVYLTAKNVLSEIQSGRGPYLIEAMTYRWLEHCGPNYDNHIGYRTEDEFLRWKKKDPLSNYEKKLLRESVITEELITNSREEILRDVRDAIQYAKSSPYPEASQMNRNVYAW